VKIYETRVVSGLSIEDISTKLNISVKQYLQYENSEVNVPLWFIKKLAEITNISSNYILEIDKHPFKPYLYK